jgi:serine/threonine protein kinase
MVTSDLGACEWFVWDLRRSGLIDRGPLDAIVGEYLKRNPRAEAPALAGHLVEQGAISSFQAERILNGKSQGLVLGPFVLLDAIGSGSMGQVFKASSKNDANLYAVKVLPRRSMWNVRLARRQVRSFSNFSHPAVVPFMDVGTAGGLHYLVWPLVEGVPLENRVQEYGRLQPCQAALYALQIAQGLAMAHQNSLFHGLLKPSNVMIGSDNQARVLDFGIGSLLVENEGESLVDTMSTANTLTSGLDCASPESIMEPTNRTPAGDQYSLGCTLYYCLTGRVPFPEGSAVEKMMAHQSKEPMEIRELAPDVPAGLSAIVKRLMAKTPEGRFSSCDDVVEALEPFLGDLRTIPGGVPKSGSGRVSTALLSRGPAPRPGSSGRMAGLGSQPGSKLPAPGSHPGAKPHSPGSHPGMRSPMSAPGSHPGMRSPVPAAGSHSTLKVNPPSHHGSKLNLPPVLAGPRAQTPVPPRGPNLPSRASLQAAQYNDGGAGHDTPIETTHANRAATPSDHISWEEEVSEPKPSAFGPLGMIAAAMFIMVAVYLGTTLLMK